MLMGATFVIDRSGKDNYFQFLLFRVKKQLGKEDGTVDDR
jgi:hypothetical protein